MAEMKALTVKLPSNYCYATKLKGRYLFIASWQPTKHGFIIVTQKWSLSSWNAITKFYLWESIKKPEFLQENSWYSFWGIHMILFHEVGTIIDSECHTAMFTALKPKLSFMKLVHHWKNCIENGFDYAKNQIQVTRRLISRIIFLFYLLSYYLWYQRHCFSYN